MPTLSPYIAAPEDDDEDGSFAQSLSRATPPPAPAAAPSAAPPAPAPAAAAPSAAPQQSDDDQQWAAPAYPSVDRTRLQAAQSQYATDAAPINRAQYAPSRWDRLKAGLAAGLMGFGGNPEAAAQAGGAIRDRRYNQAYQDQQQRMAADKANIDSQQQGVNSQIDDWTHQNTAFRSQMEADRYKQLNADRAAQEKQRLASIAPGSEQPDDPKNPMGSWHAVTVGGQAQALSGPPDSWLKTPAGVAAVREDQIQRWRQGGHPLSPDQETYFRANGKLHDPSAQTHIHMPSAEAEELHTWESAFKSEYHRAPNAEEIEGYKHGSGRGGGSGQKPLSTEKDFQNLVTTRDREYAARDKRYQSDLAAAEDGEKPALTQAYEDWKAGKQDEWNERLSAADPTGKLSHPNGPPAAATAPAPAQAPPAQQPPPARPAAPPPQQPQEQVRILKDAQGNRISAVVRNGKWVNQQTGKPL